MPAVTSERRIAYQVFVYLGPLMQVERPHGQRKHCANSELQRCAGEGVWVCLEDLLVVSALAQTSLNSSWPALGFSTLYNRPHHKEYDLWGLSLGVRGLTD